MSKHFIEGNIYVFVAKKVLRTCKSKVVRRETNGWAKEINGNRVDVINSYNGHAGKYGVTASWCKCIGREKK